MDRLPNEILLMISKTLDFRDRLNFRRCSKRFAAIAIPSVFSYLRLRFHPDSFQNVVHISRTPWLCNSVRGICYEGAIKRDVPFEEWKRNIRPPGTAVLPHPPPRPLRDATSIELARYVESVLDWQGRAQPSAHYSDAELEAGYDAYLIYREKVTIFNSNYKGFGGLAMSFMRFPNLKSLHFCTFPLAYSPCHSLPSHLVKEGHLEDFPQGQEIPLYYHQVAIMMQAITVTSPKLEQLNMQTIYWSVLDDHMNPQGLPCFADAFTRLKRLKLHIIDCNDHLRVRDAVAQADGVRRQEFLGMALKQAQLLKILTLIFGKRLNKREIPPIDWRRIFEWK